MNSDLTQLVAHIREEFPRLDVRTDQCDIVRVYGHKLWAAFIDQREGSYRLRVISLMNVTDFNDFEDEIVKIVVCPGSLEFEKSVLAELGQLTHLP